MATHSHDRSKDNDCIEIQTVRDESESILLTIMRTLAAAKNEPVTELDLLYDQIDFEPMVDLLAHTRDSDITVSVEFTIEDYTIVVSNNDIVYVHDEDPALIDILEDG